MTRERMCEIYKMDKRRLSSALSPLSAVGLLVEPESFKVGNANQLVIRQRMPGVKLFRNYRQEEASAQINSYIDYYFATK